MNAINISKNPVQHSRTKYIDICHLFIRELVENKCIVLEHVGTNDQLADLFTKPLDETRFKVPIQTKQKKKKKHYIYW